MEVGVIQEHNSIMIWRSILLSFFLCCSICICAQTNLSKYKNTDVSSLSDEQIKTIAAEMSKRGYTIEQVEVMAKTQGASDKQIQDLKKRLANSKYTATISSNQGSAITANTTLNGSGLTSDWLEEMAKSKFSVAARDTMVFGYSLFNNNKLTFEPNLNIPTPEGYILGPGDVIVIDVWGQSQMSYELSVNNNGSIDIPLAGPVYVSGVTVAEARTRIMAKLKVIYGDLGHSTTASVHTGTIRTITVNVMGEVFAPGTYTVSGAASLFNVLYLSGGPTYNGSFRNIQLIREGKVVATLDVYDFLLNYNSEVNVPLYNGDIIMVPTYQKRVAVGGEFKRNGYFEAKEGETVDDLIRYAGGFTPQALADKVSLTRQGKFGKVFQDVVDATSVMLMNGDSISVVKAADKRIDNVVFLTGNGVFYPGNYEYAEGMKLSELLQKAGGITENAFTTRGVITRLKDDYTLQSLNFNVADLAAGRYDLVLNNNDNVLVAAIDDMRDAPNLIIKGAVRSEGVFAYREGITLGDLILLAGGLTTDASTLNVEIVRRLSYAQADTANFAIANSEYVNITRDLKLDDEGNSFILQPFDIVTIRQYISTYFKGMVTVSGEVRFAGTYELVDKKETVVSMLNRAGGLSDNAYIKGAKLYRRVKLDDKERIIKMQQAKAQSVDTLLVGSIIDFDTYELVSIDLNSIMQHPDKYRDFTLQDGDEIVVPSRLQTVRVSGQVLNPISLTWSRKCSARKFISKAGGFAVRAKKNKTYVVYPDGHAEATKSFLFIKNYPTVEAGCEVIVPERAKRTTTVSQVVGISSSLATIAVLIVSLIK